MALDRRGFLLAVLVATGLVGKASAATYVVGDSLGWRIPSTPNEYTTWASPHVFTSGDVLVFNFITGKHDVAEVGKAAFDDCSSTTPMVLATIGPWNTTLNTTGEHYYICTFGTHCSLGQKLAINVTATSSPSPAPSPPLVPTPAPVPGVNPTPPSPSPTPMPGPPSPSPTPMPGSPVPSVTPGGSPSPGTPPSTPGGPPSPPSPGSSGPPSPPSPSPGSSATLPTMSATLVVFASVAFGLIM